MSDPFASLLNSFKNGPKKGDVDNGSKSQPYNNGRDANISESKLEKQGSILDFSEPIIPSRRNSKAQIPSLEHKISPTSLQAEPNTDNHDDLEILFGINRQQPANQTITKDNSYQNDFDAAFDVFEKSPEVEVETKEENEEQQVVDEVRDMEVAKLMSLGYSIDHANELYENGCLYEDALRKNIMKRSTKQAKQLRTTSSNAHQGIKNNHQVNETQTREQFGSLFDGGGKRDGFFSMATDLLNKGKQIVDQFTNFPEEQDRMNRSRVIGEVPIKPKYSVYTEEETQQTTPMPKSALEENLIDNLNEKMAVADPIKVDALMDSFETDVTGLESPPQEKLLDFEQRDVREETNEPPFHITQISDIELSGYNEFKDRASIFFKNGDYISALQEYEKSLNTLPSEHPLRVIAYSNIMATQLKVGEYKKILQCSKEALELFPKDTSLWKLTIQNSTPAKTFGDIWSKIVMRRAEAFEHVENYQQALDSYQSLISNNFFSDKMMAGKRRCQKFLNPQPKKNNDKNNKPVRNDVGKSEDVFVKDKPIEVPKSYESVKKLKEENQQEQILESERAKLYDKVFDRIEMWKGGKEEDIRHLLSNLSPLLTWCNWKAIEASDLVMPKKVKIAYMKAVAKTHPDKVPSSSTLEQKMIAENVFSTLSTAWEKFKADNNMN